MSNYATQPVNVELGCPYAGHRILRWWFYLCKKSDF